MKPVRFVEMGCPAVDKGANQPNVFYDPKSAESGRPHFSSGSRDDVVQRRAVEAFCAHWADPSANPASAEYAGRMIPDDGVTLWAWDARPFPAFPARDDVWSDAANWRLGHWLNGRAGVALLPAVVGDICARAGVAVDAAELDGVVSGYRFDGPLSARMALEPLATAYGVDAIEQLGGVAFRMSGSERLAIDAGRLAEIDGQVMEITRSGLEGEAVRVRLRFVDAETDHEPGVVVSAGRANAHLIEVEAAVVMDRQQAQACADMLAERLALERARARFAMAADGAVVETGDVISLGDATWRVTRVTSDRTIAFEVVRAGGATELVPALTRPSPWNAPMARVEPDVAIVDAPPLPGQEDDFRPIGFAFAEPWVGPVTFRAGPVPVVLTKRGRVERPCAIGRLVSALYPHVSGRWQDASVWVSIGGPTLSSQGDAAVFNGANVAMVETDAGWELLQFREAELVDVETYKLTGLLRGQQGSEDAMMAGAPAGSRIVVLTGAEQRLAVADWERGLELEWHAGHESVGDVAAWTGEFIHHALVGHAWSPAHLDAIGTGADVSLKWVRRARKGGDPWLAGEPEHEWPEGYRVRISGGIAAREWDVTEAVATYSASDQATDFPVGGSALIEVAQLGADGEPGAWSRLELTIPAP